MLLVNVKHCQDNKFDFNPYLTNGLSHHYHLGESTLVFRDIDQE